MTALVARAAKFGADNKHAGQFGTSNPLKVRRVIEVETPAAHSPDTTNDTLTVL